MASWAWQSILASKEVIMKGWRWRVGNGERVQIWHEPWLNDEHYPKILTQKGGSNLMKVSELIDPSTMAWKEPLIKQYFVERDVGQILGIPLSRTGAEDKLMWKCTTSGQFSVKSAYTIAKELIQSRRFVNHGRGQSSGDGDDEGGWKRVWHMKAPMKTKLFLWRCLHGIIPVNMALVQRKVDVDPICSLCGLEEETPSHMFFNCVRATKVWLLSPFRYRSETTSSAHLKDFWKELGINTKGAEQMAAAGLFASIGWHIWIARNSWIFKQQWTLETEILEHALDDHQTFLQAVRQERSNDQEARDIEAPRWQPPEVGVLKVNVDGAFDGVKRRGGVGVVVRDQVGNILGAAALPITCSLSAEMVEADGFRCALNSALCSVDKCYVVEGDAQTVVKMIQGQSAVKACLDVIIEDTRLLAKKFISCSFNFVPRTCNRVANAIAKFALSLETPTIWQENVPSWIYREALLDISPISLS